MEPTIIDWEKLIPPVDPADIPLVPSGDYPASATIIDKAVHQAGSLVKQSRSPRDEGRLHLDAIAGVGAVLGDDYR